jgi:phosphatidylserine/phosphatidylglycerophosphate/cardiolipin synthase-like enzyme
MSLTGSAAGDAHRFAEIQWQWTCANRSWLTWSTWSVWANRWAAGKINDDCPPAYKLADVDGGGDATVLALGRLAWVDKNNAANDADLALEVMIRAARTSVKISQQDLGPPTVPVLGIPLGSWPQGTLSAIGSALVRDVDVYLVMSNVGAVAGGLSATVAPYANGWSMDEIVQRVRAEMIARPNPGQPSGAALDELICRKLHVAPLRFGPDEAFPDGVTFPNHAKLVVVDDVAAYVGSQNLYDAGLTEFGYLVDDDVAAAGLLARYWSPLWQQSKRVAVSGADAPRCTLR